MKILLPCTSAAGLLALILSADTLHAQTKPVVTGTFLGDGKDARIQYLVVETREPFSDKPAIQLVFTEKDPSSSKRPGWDAGFKKLGSALILSVNRDGEIFGCEVAHSAHEKSPFSAIGQIKMKEFKVTDTTVSGHVTTGGEDDAFGQKWDVDLKFSAPLPSGAFAAVPEPTPEPEETKETDPTGPAPAAHELPLPDSATEVDIKPQVGQITFKSPKPVGAVAKELSDKLKQQGWKDGKGGLNAKNNAILMRERDGAKLTIMIQAAGAGSTGKIMAQGLDWSETPEQSAPKTSEPDSGDTIEAEANRLINEALKQVPGGVKFNRP